MGIHVSDTKTITFRRKETIRAKILSCTKMLLTHEGFKLASGIYRLKESL